MTWSINTKTPKIRVRARNVQEAANAGLVPAGKPCSDMGGPQPRAGSLEKAKKWSQREKVGRCGGWRADP